MPRLPEDHPGADTAKYIAAMTAELAMLARGAQLDLLAYFLEMARMEASSQFDKARRRRPARPKDE